MLNLISYDLILLSVTATETFLQTILGYLGPGAAISTIGTFLVILLALIVAFVGFIWYPVKRLSGRKKLQEPDAVPNPEE